MAKIWEKNMAKILQKYGKTMATFVAIVMAKRKIWQTMANPLKNMANIIMTKIWQNDGKTRANPSKKYGKPI